MAGSIGKIVGQSWGIATNRAEPSPAMDVKNVTGLGGIGLPVETMKALLIKQGYLHLHLRSVGQQAQSQHQHIATLMDWTTWWHGSQPSTPLSRLDCGCQSVSGQAGLHH